MVPVKLALRQCSTDETVPPCHCHGNAVPFNPLPSGGIPKGSALWPPEALFSSLFLTSPLKNNLDLLGTFFADADTADDAGVFVQGF